MSKKFPLFIFLFLLQGCSGLPSKSNPEVFSTKQQYLSDGTLGYVFCTEGDGAWKCPSTSKKTPFGDASSEALSSSDSGLDAAESFAQNAKHSEGVNHLASQDLVGQGYRILGSLLFAFDESELSAEAKVKLIDLMGELKGREAYFVGYTDAVGGEDYNQGLAVSRAKSVADFIGRLGFPKSDYKAEGRGACCYVSDNDGEKGRSLNRRVEIYIR